MYLEWDADDRSKVMAYFLEKSLECSSCGTAGWQWDPEQGGHPLAFEAVATTCPGCARRDIAREMKGKGPNAPGEHMSLVPRAAAEKMAQTPRRRPRSPREQKAIDKGR